MINPISSNKKKPSKTELSPFTTKNSRKQSTYDKLNVIKTLRTKLMLPKSHPLKNRRLFI